VPTLFELVRLCQKLEEVLKGVAPPGITVETIYRATIPYFWLTILMMTLIFVIPGIVTAGVELSSRWLEACTDESTRVSVSAPP
jgi:hypothetical protein